MKNGARIRISEKKKPMRLRTIKELMRIREGCRFRLVEISMDGAKRHWGGSFLKGDSLRVRRQVKKALDLSNTVENEILRRLNEGEKARQLVAELRQALREAKGKLKMPNVALKQSWPEE